MDNRCRKQVFLYVLGFACCLMVAIQVAAQEDMEISLRVDVTKKIIKGLHITFEEEYRSRSNLSETDRFSHSLELSYKPLSYLKLGGAYNLINFNHEKKSWEQRHRYYFYATGSKDVGRFTFALRERFQSTLRQGVPATKNRANPKLYLRSRLKIDYNIRKCPIDPYVSFELFNTLNDPQKNDVRQWRGIAGVDYKLRKNHLVTLFYRYTNYTDEDAMSIHMVGIGYSFSF